MSITKTKKPTVTSFEDWVESATHYPRLPSGSVVGIVIPDLPKMIETGQIPQDLLDVALNVASGSDVTPSVELIKSQREYTDKIVELTVVEPKLTLEQIARIPFEDKDMLVAFAQRQRDLDAEGEHLAGLTKSEKFRKFRRLGEFDEDVAGL